MGRQKARKRASDDIRKEIFRRFRLIIQRALLHTVSHDEYMSIIEAEFLLNIMERCYKQELYLPEQVVLDVTQHFDSLLHTLPSLKTEYARSGLKKGR